MKRPLEAAQPGPPGRQSRKPERADTEPLTQRQRSLQRWENEGGAADLAEGGFIRNCRPGDARLLPPGSAGR